MLTFSVPLGDKPRSPRLYSNLSHTTGSGASLQAGVNGYMSENTSYSLQAGHSRRDGSSTAGLSVNHSADFVQLSAAYNAARRYQSGSVGASGAIVVHGGGVNLSRTVGDTFALMQVDGLSGAELRAGDGGKLARNGYLVQPYAQPYRVNTLNLDTRQLGADAELEDTVQQVVPRRGAVVRACSRLGAGCAHSSPCCGRTAAACRWRQRQRRRWQALGIVDPNGKVLALLKQETGRLTVTWRGGQCVADYRAPPARPASTISGVV